MGGLALNFFYAVLRFLLASGALDFNRKPFLGITDEFSRGGEFLVRDIPLAKTAGSLAAHEAIEMHHRRELYLR